MENSQKKTLQHSSTENLVTRVDHVNLRQDRLGQLVSEVRADAQVAPDAYLNDAIVPEGGE